MNAADPVPSGLSGLDLLSSAVIVLDGKLLIRYLNAAAENLFAVSQRVWLGRPLAQLAGTPPALDRALENALANNWSYTGHNIAVTPEAGASEARAPLHLDCTVTPVDVGSMRLLLEFRPIDQQIKAMREEREAMQQQANRELIRNLAHEIKNPLGGIRGSAQLLEHELASVDNAPALREYTQVIIKEADRLQDLMRRLLSSHRGMQPAQVNVHELLERVRRLIHAEYPGVRVRRDYDTSLPEVTGDREQLIQAILNIARNAAQAIMGTPPPGPRPGGGGARLIAALDSHGARSSSEGADVGSADAPSALGAARRADSHAGVQGEIVLRTRALRQVTLAKKRHRLALELQVIDNGPGIPEAIRDKIFYPLVSGREGGSGLGLTLAQSIVHQHAGSIDVESQPGRTCFIIRLPLSGGSDQEAGK